MGWIVYRSIGPHTVCYMNEAGAEAGAADRYFFDTAEEATATAIAFGWRTFGLARQNRP